MALITDNGKRELNSEDMWGRAQPITTLNIKCILLNIFFSIIIENY